MLARRLERKQRHRQALEDQQLWGRRSLAIQHRTATLRYGRQERREGRGERAGQQLAGMGS